MEETVLQDIILFRDRDALETNDGFLMIKNILIFLLSLVVVFSAITTYASDPFSAGQDKKETDEDEESKEPAYPPYSGPRKRVAVTKFDNKVKGVYGNQNLGEGMSEMLVTELIKTNRFVVVERQALQDILGEQELGQTGVVKKETAAKVGQVLGAQIIVRGVVSEFEQKESGGDSDFKYKGFSLGLKTSQAHVGIDIRLIDTTTGQILHSHNAVGNAQTSALKFGVEKGDIDFNIEGFKNTPLGQATRQAIQNAVNFIIGQMETMPFTAKVVKSDNGNIYINTGSQANIKTGDRYFAYSVGEHIVDPDTGLKLGAEEKPAGTIEIRDVKDKFSIANLISGRGALKRGDVIKEGIDIQRFDVPEAAKNHFNHGKTMFKEKDYAEAEKAYRQAVAKAPDFALGYNEIGVALTWQNKWGDAIPHYQRAVKLKPDAAVFHKNLAQTLEKTGKLEEAIKEYEAVLNINPNNREAREKALIIPALILRNKKDYAGAQQELLKASEQLPESASINNELGVTLSRQGKKSEAVSYYQKAIQFKPESAVYHKNLAIDLEKIGKMEEAKKEYEAILKLNPNDSDAKEKVMLFNIISLEERGDTKGAKDLFEEAVDHKSSEAQVMWQLDGIRATKNRAAVPKEKQAWLGVNIKAFGPEEMSKFQEHEVKGLPETDVSGYLVVSVDTGSPAGTAGLRPAARKHGSKGSNPEDFSSIGDIITEIDGQPAMGRLSAYLASKQAGDTVSLKIMRNGKFETLTVSLALRPN
jgi:curli biogenesis system outer membrane secretion channel CsgG/tetratricopeptide (TPR) repeat protein